MKFSLFVPSICRTLHLQTGLEIFEVDLIAVRVFFNETLPDLLHVRIVRVCRTWSLKNRLEFLSVEFAGLVRVKVFEGAHE